MTGRASIFLVQDRWAEIRSHLHEVIAAADSDKGALGFFPRSVIEDFARREQLIIATDNQGECAGYLMYDCPYPKAAIRQIFTLPKYRRKGVGKLMVDFLKATLTKFQYLAITARVADDLPESNRFWEKAGFFTQRIERGGASKGRMIVVRCHELTTPRLFAAAPLEKSNPLRLNEGRLAELPLFLLDMNVLFDLRPRRPRNEAVLSLFRAERHGLCTLAISSEIKKELERHASNPRTDPMLAYTRILPTFDLIEENQSGNLFHILGKEIFDNSDLSALDDNSRSDLRHVATAIANRLAGLVTSDSSLLGRAASLRKLFGLRVVSPEAFADSRPGAGVSDEFELIGEGSVEKRPLTSQDVVQARRLLHSAEVAPSDLSVRWAATDDDAPGFVRLGIFDEGHLCGYVVMTAAQLGSSQKVHAIVDEARTSAEIASRVAMNAIVQHVNDGVGVGNIVLCIPPRQVSLKQAAWDCGFREVADGVLSKVTVGAVVTAERWAQFRAAIRETAYLTLPDQIPAYRAMSQQIRLLREDDEIIHVPLEELESLLGPALFCLPGRPVVMVPIQPKYSERLLGSGRQATFLAKGRASLFQRRHFFCDAKALKKFAPGSLLLFYESGQKGEGVIAIARVVRSFLKIQTDIDDHDLAPSALDSKLLSDIGQAKTKSVAVFDSVFRFRRPIPLSDLQSFGHGQPNQLITASLVAQPVVERILAKAFQANGS
jgi:GNAT superfamily N-acetyltransferase